MSKRPVETGMNYMQSLPLAVMIWFDVGFLYNGTCYHICHKRMKEYKKQSL